MTCILNSLLAETKQDFTTASLGILASYRKREQLKCLLRSLHMIKTLVSFSCSAIISKIEYLKVVFHLIYII